VYISLICFLTCAQVNICLKKYTKTKVVNVENDMSSAGLCNMSLETNNKDNYVNELN